MERIQPELTDGQHVVVRLLRRYAACRQLDEQPLPPVTRLGSELGISPSAAVALASVFQLTEECLGRSLIAECCCNRTLSRDERAILLLLRSAPAGGPVLGSTIMPHGLPGALAWAVASARQLFGSCFSDKLGEQGDYREKLCPFM